MEAVPNQPQIDVKKFEVSGRREGDVFRALGFLKCVLNFFLKENCQEKNQDLEELTTETQRWKVSWLVMA